MPAKKTAEKVPEQRAPRPPRMTTEQAEAEVATAKANAEELRRKISDEGADISGSKLKDADYAIEAAQLKLDFARKEAERFATEERRSKHVAALKEARDELPAARTAMRESQQAFVKALHETSTAHVEATDDFNDKVKRHRSQVGGTADQPVKFVPNPEKIALRLDGETYEATGAISDEAGILGEFLLKLAAQASARDATKGRIIEFCGQSLLDVSSGREGARAEKIWPTPPPERTPEEEYALAKEAEQRAAQGTVRAVRNAERPTGRW